MRGSLFLSVALLLAVRQPGSAQDIVSASSGVVQYFEGAVTLDDTPVEHKAAVFPSLKNGSTIRTDKGRAELLLTPGVYLRIDEDSSLRMTSNSLTDTRLELTEGAFILDSLNATSAGAVTLVFEGSAVRFPKPGVYRIDCKFRELQVYSGEAEVKCRELSSTVDSSHLYYFGLEITTKKLGDGAMDEFYDWAHNRSEVIAGQNQISSAEQEDAQDADLGAGASGLFVAPPPYAAPGCATPPSSMPAYGYGSSINQFYLYQPAPYLTYAPFPSIILLAPLRSRPGGTFGLLGSGIGYGYRPRPVITRWPAVPQSGLYHYPSTTLTHPVGATYHPVGTPSATHAAASHVGVVGHR